MLLQLHWKYKDGRTVMKAQQEINSYDEMRAFVKETQEEYPLSDGVFWIACNESSKDFIKNNELLGDKIYDFQAKLSKLLIKD